jgi:uncharacterized DUF497 family protein
MRFRFGALDFSWDERKANANAKKHRVTFEEAGDRLRRSYGSLVRRSGSFR